MKSAKRLIAILACSAPLWVNASPPMDSSRKVKVTQPDGVSFYISQRGNVWFNWKETRDGRVIIKNKETGYYYYAQIDNSSGKARLVPSHIKVNPELQKNTESGNSDFKALTAKDLKPLQIEGLKRKKNPGRPIKINPPAEIKK